ncbi:MAG TPA: carbonic anhydrase [Candidatus Angelobacter sp.]|nr:carbonic anhydrase [Candidatus Angelobacter sp.]
MRKIFHFASPRERYTADAAVVWCFDHRFDLVLHKLLKKIGVERFDPILVAGGAKNLSSPPTAKDREFVLDQIRASIQLHSTKNVILMLHSDCGGYGGLAAFNNDPAQEAENHRQEMHKAVACLKKEIPAVEVRAFFVDFEGVWEADITASTEKAS